MNKKICPQNLILLILSTTLFWSCRGQFSDEPPIVPIQNMVNQTSYGPQSGNEFYADGRAARPSVQGTVAKDDAKIDVRLSSGMEINSTKENPVWVKKFPIVLTKEILDRGQERYNIYCAPCHGYAANNDGIVTLKSNGSIRPANLHDLEKINLPVGRIYDAVANGVNNWNMPGFSEQLSVQDRWAVVAYVRALQFSKQAVGDDVPDEIKVKNGWSKK